VPEIDTNLLESKIPGLMAAFSGETFSVTDYRGDLMVVVPAARLREVVRFLKSHPSLPFEMMMDLFAMDYSKKLPETPERFAVIYQLYSVTAGRRVHLKVFLPEEKPEVESIHDLYAAANWFEREAWDLFGVVFVGHPHLIRILCHGDFVGHPLRKDYPSDQYQRLKNAAPVSGL